MAGTRRTYVKRISIGRPITSINQAASGVVSAATRSAGQILINDATTNLYQSGDLLGGTGLNALFDSNNRTITLSLDSADLKSIIDSNYIAFVTSSPFVDSAYVEANSLDSERTLSLLDSSLTNWTNHIVPSLDSTYDLGDSDRRWRSLYLSGQTIYLGSLLISDDSTTLAVKDSAGNLVQIDLGANTTSDLAEGNNLYYTRARFDSALATSLSTSSIRSYFSSVDSGGDGAFSYDSTNGVFTYRGPSAAEVRAHFSAQGDLSYDSATGVFSFDVEQVYTQANFESDLSQSVAGGTGITYDSATQTISITNTGVIAGEYGSQTQVPIITVNAQGQIDSIGEILVAGVTGFSWDSSVEQLTINTADGGSFVATVNGFNSLQADSAVITDISGTTLNYGTGRISQLTSDSASITTIDNNVLRTNDLSADSGIVTNISGTSLNYGTGNFTSATAAGLTVNGVSNLDSTNVDGSLYVTGDLTVQGTTTTVNSTTVTINDKNIVVADSAADLTALNGAGFTMGGANIATPPEMKYVTTGNLINFNRAVDIDGHVNADSATFVNLNVTGLATTTISRAATVDSGTYGSATLIPVMTVNASGFIDSIGEIAVAGVSGVSWDSTNEQLTINTADGGSFVTTINGFDSAQITNVSGTTLNYAQVLSDSAKVISISGTDLNYGTGQISQLTVDSGTFTTLAINGRTIDSDWVQSFAKNFEGDITITTTQDDAAAGPSLILYRNTASPADSDLIGQIVFKGEDNSSNAQEYAKIRGVINDASGDSENGAIEFIITDSGSDYKVAILNGQGLSLLGGANLSVDGNIVYQGTLIDSSWVGERSRVITAPEFKVISVSDNSTLGPKLVLDRNSASPADSDDIGYIEFRGRNSADSEIEYGSIRAFIEDASADSADGRIEFHLRQAGFDREKLSLTSAGVELARNEALYFKSDSGSNYLHGQFTQSHNLLLPDSSGTILTRDFVTTLIDSSYIGIRQSAASLQNNTTDDLTEGSTNLFYTVARADSAARSALLGIDAGGDGSFTYDSATGTFTYTGPSASEARAHFQALDLGGDGSFTYDSATGNFTYTGPSAADARAHFSATDAGGDGSFSYNSGTGAFTYTGPSAADARAHFSSVDSGGDGAFFYDSSNGVFTYRGPSAAEVRAHFSSVDSGGDGAFFYDSSNGVFTYRGPSAAEVRAHVSATDAGGDGSFSYNSGTGAFTYTGPSASEARAHFSGGTGVTITDGSVAIGQPVATTDSVTFSGLTVSGNLTVSGTQSVINTEVFKVIDPLIHLGDSNINSDIVDIGFIGKYYADGQERHTGLVRVANDGEYYLYINSIDSASDSVNNINLSAPGFTLANLNAGTVTASLVGNVTGNVSGSSGSTTGNAATATALQNPRTIGLSGDVTAADVSFDGTGNITLTTAMANNSVDLTTHTTGNYVQQGATSGNGISGSVNSEGGTFTVTSNATNANTVSTIVFRDGSGNFSAGTVTATTFSGALSGNATTATTLATGRTISLTGDVTGTSGSFDGSGNVSITAALAANTVSSTELVSASTLLIKNSSGTILKTIIGAGS